MKFSEIKVQHIYNVIFDPVRDCEFDGKHLALVLKINNDKKTFIVLPLTTSPNGIDTNKLKIGAIPTLPSSINKHITYAVVNQIRTVNASRFIALKEGSDKIDSSIDVKLFLKLFYLCMNDLTYCLTPEDRMKLFKDLFDSECANKIKELAYTIIKLKKDVDKENKEIASIESELSDILNLVPDVNKFDVIDENVKKIISSIKQ